MSYHAHRQVRREPDDSQNVVCCWLLDGADTELDADQWPFLPLRPERGKVFLAVRTTSWPAPAREVERFDLTRRVLRQQVFIPDLYIAVIAFFPDILSPEIGPEM